MSIDVPVFIFCATTAIAIFGSFYYHIEDIEKELAVFFTTRVIRRQLVRGAEERRRLAAENESTERRSAAAGNPEHSTPKANYHDGSM